MGDLRCWLCKRTETEYRNSEWDSIEDDVFKEHDIGGVVLWLCPVCDIFLYSNAVESIETQLKEDELAGLKAVIYCVLEELTDILNKSMKRDKDV